MARAMARSAMGTAVLVGGSLCGAAEPVIEEAGDPRDHVALARSIVAFAVDPSPEQAARLPFAAQVRLGLGSDLVVIKDRSALGDDSEWLLHQTYFRAYVGPFSALRVLRHQVDDAGTAAIGVDGAFEVTTGPYPHCASPSASAPVGFDEHLRVSVRPATSTYDSCLLWFAVDLFVDDDGAIAAVTLDLWEP